MNPAGVPNGLFKYFAPERTDVLASREHRYSPLSAFNDPFEGRPNINGASSHEDLRGQVLRQLDSEIERQYARLPAERRSLIPFEDFNQKMRLLADAHMDNAIAQHQPHLDAFTMGFPDHLSGLIGAFCLCEAPDNLLMWAHYASSHTGFVVEYDTNNSYFRAKRTEKDEFYHLRKVEYHENRASASFTQLAA